MYGIFPCIWLHFMVNVGEYTSPMDAMGYKSQYYWSSYILISTYISEGS